MRTHRLSKPSASIAALVLVSAASLGGVALTAAGASAKEAPTVSVLDRALTALVSNPSGPPGVAVVVQHGGRLELHRAGVANVATGAPFRLGDWMRLASVAKAYSGATALALVSDGTLSLTDTVGKWLPNLPTAWANVTLRELLQHTSGIPDFSQSPKFAQAVAASPFKPPPPRVLPTYARPKLLFQPGTRYKYSNTDNVVAALMIEAATGRSYEAELRSVVLTPLGLSHTRLPRGARLPSPFIHGYAVAPPAAPEDVSHAFAAGWAWASGGVISTLRDANSFVRAYVRGTLLDQGTRAAQLTFIPGRSEPTGPGKNSAGLALFRYQTRCGTVYGHTGNTAGYTQFVAASRNGRNSVVVSVNAQITPDSDPQTFTQLRRIYTLAVCTALHQ
jgi:D-alanyl-D-alanine carboxypeptidase